MGELVDPAGREPVAERRVGSSPTKRTTLETHMQLYQVWQEGYCITGGSSPATYCGSAMAESFQAACDKVLKHNTLYNPKSRSVWGCRLFDNEGDARRSFG